MGDNLKEKTDQKTYNDFLRGELLVSPEVRTDMLGFDANNVNLVMTIPDTPRAFWRSAGMQVVANEAARAGANIDFAYLPFPNVSEDAEKNGLRTLYSGRPLNSADIIGVSLPNPGLFFSLLKMLELGGISVERRKRIASEPLIVAGHMGISNPAPFEPFIDAFVIGDGDDVIAEIVDAQKRDWRNGKQTVLEEIAKIDGVYVPEFAERIYDANGTLVDVIYRGNDEGIVRQRVLQDLSKYRRASLFVKKGSEGFVYIDYGCKYKCAFCQMANLRGRYRSNASDEVIKYLREMDKLGVENVVLAGASSTNYPTEELKKILLWAKGNLKKTKLIIRSVRIDDVVGIAEFLDQEYLHIAPETGTDSLRNKILLKTIKNVDIYANIGEMVGKGINDVRMYCIVGVPTERKEDRMAYVDIIHYTAEQIKKTSGSGSIRIDMYPLMAQPGAPFEEFGMVGIKRLAEIKDEFETAVRQKLPEGIEFELNAFDKMHHVLEGLLNTGDVTAGLLAYEAYQNGANFEALEQVCRKNGVEIYDHIPKGNWKAKPWKPIQFINSGYLENQKAQLARNIERRNAGLL